jgi:hypothetical protein
MTNNWLLNRLLYILITLNFIVAGGLIYVSFLNSSNLQKTDKTKTESVVLGTSSIPLFNPNFIISNETFGSTRAFPTQSSVQNYLVSVDSPLKNYYDQGQPASYWIFAAARGQTSTKFGITPKINPGLLLAYLEKEQSLLSLSDYDTNRDPQNRIRTAMGYGCPDDKKCDTQYYGLANQLNWGAYQLQFNYNLSTSSTPDGYKLNKTISTLDGYSIFLSNEATAAQYRYTPHVFWGNYNLWKIMVANGWGISTQTYSMNEIDRVNLSRTDLDPEDIKVNKIEFFQVESILQKNYAIGTENSDISLLQQFLKQQGYFTFSSITGFYGNITKTSHENYLRDKNINISQPEAQNNQDDNCQSLFDRSWQFGQSGEDVRQLQVCLRNQNVFDWPSITGFYGNITQSGLNKIKKTPSNPKSSCQDLKARKWQFGQSGEDVRQLQVCLQQEGLYKWQNGITGFFGDYTRQILTNTSQTISGNCENLKTESWILNERSQRVINLQKCMQTAGTFNHSGGLTGFFGEVTKQALINWRGYF